MKRTRGAIGRNRGRVLDEKYLNEVIALLGDESRDREFLIEHLHKIQDKFRCISSYHIQALAQEMNLPTAEIYEVATFYHHFDVTKEYLPTPPRLTVRVCESLTCEMFGSRKLLDELHDKVGKDIRIQNVPCVGRCSAAPVAIVGTHPVEHANCGLVTEAIDKNQTEIVVGDYVDLVQYKSNGGYKLLQACLSGTRSQDEVINMLSDSNLRGLGGAGFPAGRKWSILQKQPTPKLVAVNIDEGEPGTFKDRYYLEQDPHRFLEGSLIAHWAVGAEAIYIYLRDEYAGCRLILEKELQALRNNPPIDLPPIHLRRGAGAYICGEESAMIESIEGKRGMPRLRPPYVAEVGLFGRPTLEHNMETLHWIRDIIEKGPQWFTSHGRKDRKGLRSFSVSGRVNNPGVHLAPAGITIRELIDEFCGGMLEGHEFYGYFPGGASGGMLPAALDDIPLDFDTLQEYGSFIGSAAVIVLSNHDSAKELALNAMRFFEHESCGQCTPCRVGTAKAVQLMSKKEWDRPLLEELSAVMEDASICGLGQAAPNPLRTAIRYFPEEFK